MHLEESRYALYRETEAFLAGNDAVGQAFTVWAYRHSAMVLGTLVLLIYFAALVIEQLRQEQFGARDAVFPRPAKRWGAIAHSS